jgi:gliding motility-associated-like protein
MKNIRLILVFLTFSLYQQLVAQQLVLRTDTIPVPCGALDTFLISVKADNFTNLLGLQFSMEWDTAKTQYIHLRDFNPLLGSLITMDTTTHLPKGQFVFSWVDVAGLSLPPNNNTLFKIAVVRKSGGFSTMAFDTTALPNPPPAAIVATNVSFQPLPFSLSIGGIKTIDPVPPVMTCPPNITVLAAGSKQVFGLAPTIVEACGIEMTGWSSTGATVANFPNDPDASGHFFNMGASQVTYTTEDFGGNLDTCQFTVQLSYDPSASDSLIFVASSGTANCGQSFFIDVTTYNFDSIFGAQYSLRWLSDVLEYDSIGMLNGSLGLNLATDFNLNFVNTPDTASLVFAWNTSNLQAGNTLPPNALLFRLYFSVVGGSGANTALFFSSTPVAQLSVDLSLNPIPTAYISGEFEVIDPTPPQIQCPPNQSVMAVMGAPTAEVTGIGPVTLSDNCSGVVGLTYTPASAGNGNGVGPANGTFPGGTTIVTYTATDVAGNTSTCSFSVFVDLGEVFMLKIDTVQFSCGGGSNTVTIPFRVTNFDDIAGMNFRVRWNPAVLGYTGFTAVYPGTGISAASFFNAASTAPQGFLNFLEVSQTGSWPNIPDGGIIFSLTFNVLATNGMSTLVFEQPMEAINNAGNLVAFEFLNGLFTSVDNTPPVITCPANQIAPSGPNCNALVFLLPATATDACGTVTSLTSTAPANNTYPTGTTQVVFTATDNSNNSSTCSMTVTVNANTTLSIPNCPTSAVVVEATTSCSAPITYPLLTASNPCVPNATFVYNYNYPIGSVRPVGTTTVVMNATQLGNGGGSINCVFQVNVVDAGDPVLTCPADLTVQASGTDCFVENPVVPPATVTDNCATNLTAIIDPTLLEMVPVGANNLIYLATDPAGNVGACSFTLTVEEVAPPTITCPSNQVVPVVGTCSALATWVAPTVLDNCSESQEIVVTSTHPSGAIFSVGPTVVQYTAEDEAGNTATCTFTVQVSETIPPVITGCPQDITIVLPLSSCDTVLTWTKPNASDNCALDTLFSNFAPGFNFPAGVHEVIYVAIDAAGNRDTCSFTITLQDQIAPVFLTFPADVTITDADPCGADVNITPPTAADNCDTNPVITYTGALNGNYPPGVTVIEVRVTDASGNITQQSITITIIAQQPESFINIPANQTLNGCEAIATWTPPTVAGFCSPPTITSNYQPGDLFPVGVTTVTYIAEDANGGTISATFTITVTDPTAPVFDCPTESIVVNTAGQILSDPNMMVDSIATIASCEGIYLALIEPTATDNCNPPVVSQISGPTLPGELPVGNSTVVYQAVDESANKVSCAVNIEVVPFEIGTPFIEPNPGCLNETVQVSVAGIPGAVYSWTGPEGPYPDAPQLTILSLDEDNQGAYTATATLNGCSATSEVANVLLAVKPTAENDQDYLIGGGDTLTATSVLLNDLISLPSDLSITLKSNLEGLTFNALDGTFTYIQNVPGVYSFIYEICSVACPDLCDMASVTITVQDKTCDIIPNIFTPNGDMTNDFFEIPCLYSGLYPNNSLVIFNQWGDKVFEAEGYDNTPAKSWKGTLNNEPGVLLPDGVYYYIFKQTETAPAKKGYVHIFR